MKKKLKFLLKMISYILLLLIIIIVLFVNFAPTFGDISKGNSKTKIENSPYFENGKFVNIIPTNMKISNEDNKSMFKEFFLKSEVEKRPIYSLPNEKINKKLYENNTNETLITWLGHSTVLIKINNKTILTDPIFSKRASPISFLGPKAFDYKYNYKIEDLPKIDIILISHDHYDHLDMKTIKKLKNNVEFFYVPLGIKAHLLKWGVDESKIIELDWYEEDMITNISNYNNNDNSKNNNIVNENDNSIKIISIPTRHFSGRGLNNRMSTQWTSWIIKTQKENIYFGSDSSYSILYNQIGEKYGPFDIVMLENGAYNKRWPMSHMFPNETYQAGIDLNAKILMPIHQFKFSLSFHSWDEPIELLLNESQKIENKNNSIKLITPIIGNTFKLNSKINQNLNQTWWRKLE